MATMEERHLPSSSSVSFEKAKNDKIYTDQRLVSRVICVSRNVLTSFVARKAKLLLSDSGTTDILYMPRVLLIDVVSNKSHIVFLHPKFDVLLTKHKLQPGSLIRVTQYMKHSIDQCVNNIQNTFIEIVGLDVEQTNGEDTGLPNNIKDIVQRFEWTPLPFSGITKLNFWCDMVPCFLNSFRLSSGYTISMTDLSELLKSSPIFSVSYLASSWEMYPDNSFSVLVRVLSKAKLSYYKPTHSLKNFPTRSTFLVADKTGSCVFVMWDFANKEELYTRIHLGSVLYIQKCRMKRGIMPRFPHKRSHPKMFPMELFVDYKSLATGRCSGQDIMVVNVPTTCAAETLNIVDEQYNFMVFKNHIQIPESSIIDVSGIVVGLSRFYRAQSCSSSLLGKTNVYRYIEIYDPRSQCFHQLEVFVSGLLDCHKNVSVGDSIILTFMRFITCNSLIYKCNFLYMTTTQNTEIFVLPHGQSKVDNVGPYPSTVVRELARLKVVRRKPSTVTWVGGLCSLSMATLPDTSIQEVTTGGLHWHGKLLFENLQTLLFRECKTFGLSGVIAKIDYCVVHKVEVNTSSIEIKDTVEEVIELYRNPELSNMLSHVQVYFSNPLKFHTLPVCGSTELALHIHSTLWFPPTNLVDALNTKRHQKNLTITDEDLLCNHFFRILIVPASKDFALWCIFLPPKPVGPNSDVTSKTLFDILSVNYNVDSTRVGLPAYNDLTFSKSDLDNLAETSDEIKNRNFTFILQAYKIEDSDVEISFCRIADTCDFFKYEA